MQKPVLFIDLLNLYCRCFSSVPLTDDNGLHVGGVYGTLNALQSYIKNFTPSEVYVCWEGAQSGERRRKKLKEYKEGRKFVGMRRGFETSDKDEKEAFTRQLDILKRCLENLPIKEVSVKYLEADDVIAYMAKKVVKDVPKIIISTDKDYFQLVDEDISIFRPVKTKENPKGEMVDLEWMHKKENIHPYNYALLKAIVGDKSDNVAGVNGVGEKTARKQIHLLWSDHEEFGIDDLFEWLHGRSEKKYQKYIDNEELIRNNYKVVQLLDIEISMQSITTLENSFEKEGIKFNPYKFRLKLLDENILPSNIDNWVSSFMSVQTEPITI